MSETRQRTHIAGVRLNDRELAALDAMVAYTGLRGRAAVLRMTFEEYGRRLSAYRREHGRAPGEPDLASLFADAPGPAQDRPGAPGK